jgi:hypothetical protein
MISSPYQLPLGIREDDLIDLVDGKLSGEREAVVLAALRNEPALAELVKAMQSDAQVAARLDALRAPSGLADGIEARLTAATLRDIATASHERTDAIPISTMEVRGPGIVEFLTESLWPRRLAMAASLAIVAGLGVWGVRTVMNSTPKAAPKEIATTTTTHPAMGETHPAVTPSPAPVDVAVIDHHEVVDLEPATPIAASPMTVPMTEARAAELASEGRLTVTVYTTIAQTATKKLDALAKAGGREGWRALPMDNVPSEFAMLLAPSAPVRVPTMIEPNPIIVASERPMPAAPVGVALPAPRPVVKAIYTVDVNPGEKGMHGLVRAVTDALPEGAMIVLRETPRRSEAAPALDADSVLWWNGAPGKWAKRITVPIVVEGME